MKSILITGANSYIGESFAAYIARWPESYRVITIDTRAANWESASFEGYDTVLHVAGIAHRRRPPRTQEETDLYYGVNAGLAVLAAQKAKNDGVRQFIFLSTMNVYGDKAAIGHPKTVTKGTPEAPESVYGRSKLKGEIGVRALADASFAVCVLRPPMVYGKGCKGNYNALSVWAKKLPFFPDARNRRSMIYIGNLCHFIKTVIDERADGLRLPQNAELVNTSDMVRQIALAHGKKLRLSRALWWPLRLLPTGLVAKVFGDYVYEADEDRVSAFTFEESVLLSERAEEGASL